MTTIAKMTMASQYLEAQLNTLAAFGFSIDESLNRLKITPAELANKLARFDVARLIPLYNEVAKTLGDPNISLRTGFQFRVATFQKTGNIYTVCDNIRQVVNINSIYQKLAIHAGDISLKIEPHHQVHIEKGKQGYKDDHRIKKNFQGQCFLDFSPFYSHLNDDRHITNLIFGAYGAAFRWLNWGTGKGLKAIHLQQGKPANLALFQDVFDCPVHFNADWDRLEFFPEHLDLEFPTRNPVKRAQFESQLDHVLQRDSHNQSFIKAAQVTLQENLENGSVNFTLLAKSMDLSEPKMRAAFKQANTHFREQLDLARIEYFKTLISQEESFVSIAQKLCYNDQAAFTRAFKRWYGVTPSAWKENLPLRYLKSEKSH